MNKKAIFTPLGMLIASAFLSTGFAQEVEDDDVRPSPPSIGSDIPVTYFGPPPSSVEPELIGPFQLLTAGQLDEDAGTITLPLYRGELRETGESIWYIVTDTTDSDAALALGLNHSGKLSFAENGRAVRTGATRQDGTLMFDVGSVDFSPELSVTPGNAENASLPPFPPLAFQPGSIGDELYSPLVKITNAGGHIYNAPMIAFNVDEADIDFCDGDPDHSVVHDSVVSICPADETVTLSLAAGFSFAKPVLYLSTEANDPLPAALEGATFAPGLRDVAVGRDDSLFSAVERLFLTINGPSNSVEGQVNPQRQGLFSTLSGEGGPLNVLGGIPTVATDYSPLWDLNVGEWTQLAIDRGYRSRVTEEFQILGLVERGFLTGPGGSAYGSSGFIVNCPIVHRFL
ncbi:hypothetical protein [Granulosicoccus antarcticus]|uniref:Uncharacterized protein n=1 Tax=Granulosicoccus antarcticus IMCC3135 TaxID=1192854 RepID=A0A2Z2NV62_9GAMM|nr:hypothetical protein [Granulosicoccus antarcticus]ASJ72680.1 hypothetical protein IMCC3135_12960 [Granulosicoccus antarcticus IMCC3135]